MTTPKEFDCVEMKRQIQEQLQKEAAGKTEEQARADEWRRVMSDPILGPFFARLSERTHPKAG